MSKPENGRFTRREAVQISLMTVGAGLGLMGCSKGRAPADLSLGKDSKPAARGLFFTAEEMTQLAELAEIIIPTTDTPGGRAANVHGFIDNMMEEAALPKTRTVFRALLADIDSTAKHRFGSRFMDLSPAHRVELVSAIDLATFSHEGGEDKGAGPFVRLKQLVFWGYYHSEIGATRELQFKLVPGRYESCVPLSSIGRAWVGGQGDIEAAAAIETEEG